MRRRSALLNANVAWNARKAARSFDFAKVAILRFAAPGAGRSISQSLRRVLNGSYRETFSTCSRDFAAPSMNVVVGLKPAIFRALSECRLWAEITAHPKGRTVDFRCASDERQQCADSDLCKVRAVSRAQMLDPPQAAGRARAHAAVRLPRSGHYWYGPEKSRSV